MSTITRVGVYFFEQNKEKKVYPCIPQFHFIKVGVKSIYISRSFFPDKCIRKNLFDRYYCIIQLFHAKFRRNCPDFAKLHASKMARKMTRKMTLANDVG